MSSMNPSIAQRIEAWKGFTPSEERQQILNPLIQWLRQQKSAKRVFRMQWICTHNSRRSQFAHAWSAAVGAYFDFPGEHFSGGTEVTAFHPNAVESLRRAGFEITSQGETDNPHYRLRWGSKESDSIEMYSKTYGDAVPNGASFVALMTCSEADKGCPFIPEAEARFALNYQDPKVSDGTPESSSVYDERRDQIGAEMTFVYQSVMNS